MTTVNETDFEKDVSKFLRKVKNGERVRIVSKNNEPLADIQPLSKIDKKSKRKGGLFKKEVIFVSGDFHKPLSKEELALFGIE